MKKYCIVSFPEIQDFMLDRKRFDEEAIFINDDKVPDSSYIIPMDWYNQMYNHG